jgi:hypothetical protein
MRPFYTFLSSYVAIALVSLFQNTAFRNSENMGIP